MPQERCGGTLPEKNADGRFYVAIVEIPATEYEEVEGEAENEVMSAAEVADENDSAEDTAPKTHIERKAKPLDTDKVTLSLWSVEDFNIL